MKKICFIEGLPGVGKTYLINKIRDMKIQNTNVVDELINPDIKDPFTDKEDIFLKNDELKLSLYDDGLVIIDRGPVSTLVYNQVMHLLDNNYDASFVEKWFKQFESIYSDENTKVIYLKNPGVYTPSINDDKNPFGSVENLKLTDEITVFNIKKYFKNYKIIEYKKNNVESVIDEIVN